MLRTGCQSSVPVEAKAGVDLILLPQWFLLEKGDKFNSKNKVPLAKNKSVPFFLTHSA